MTYRGTPEEACRARSPAAVLVFFAGIIVFLGSLSAAMIVYFALGDDGPSVTFLVAWTAALCWVSFIGLYWTSYEVTVHPAGHVEFMSVLRRRHVPISELRSIKPLLPWDVATLIVRYAGGSTLIVRNMHGLTACIAAMKAQNPSITTHGME